MFIKRIRMIKVFQGGKNSIYRNAYSLAKFTAMQNNPLL